MRTTYYDEDEILILHLFDKPVCREVSQDWNTHVSYAEDGSLVKSPCLMRKQLAPIRWPSSTHWWRDEAFGVPADFLTVVLRPWRLAICKNGARRT